MGKAAKQARNREIKRKQRAERIKAQVEEAKGMLALIKDDPFRRVQVYGMWMPIGILKEQYEKFVEENS